MSGTAFIHSLSDDYPYLMAVLLGLPPVAVAFALLRRERLMMLACGLAMAALSPLSVLHEGVYWSPPRLGGGAWGVEDVLCSFSVGSLVWVVAALPQSTRLTLKVRWTRFVFVLLAVCAAAVTMVLLFSRLGLPIMVATVLAQGAVILTILALRPRLWPMPLAVAGVYLPYYVLVLLLASSFSEPFHAMWNGPELLGPTILGLPIEEYLWAGTLGCTPLALALAVDVRVVGKRAREP